MKKTLSLLVAVIMLFSFAACGGKQQQPSNQGNSSSNSEYKNKNASVKISIPFDVIDDKYKNDLDGYCKAYGYESAKLNKRKNTVTIKMNYMAHRLLLTEIGMEVINGLYNVLEDGTYKYFKDIESYDDKNFASVTILVNEKAYKKDKTSSLLPFTLAQSCFVYQGYTESGIDKCDIIIKNAKTKEVIETKTYTDKNT